jgi:hypothetical protein
MSQRKSSFGKIKKGAKVRGSVFTSSVTCEGYLKKHSSGVIKRWQKRYFAIKGHYMNYYENENMGDKQLKGTIDLLNLQAAGSTSVEGEVQVIIDGVSTSVLVTPLFSFTLSFPGEHHAACGHKGGSQSLDRSPPRVLPYPILKPYGFQGPSGKRSTAKTPTEGERCCRRHCNELNEAASNYHQVS